jgi:propanediol dehydratase small subunit
VAQEYGKQGRLTLEADFERFHELIRVPADGGG